MASSACMRVVAPWICAGLWLLRPLAAHADLGSLGPLTVGIAASAGLQPDGRSCDTAGTARSFPGTGTCILFAGGVEGTFLWQGLLGASLGLWSVAGQAAVPLAEGAGGGAPAAFPDRVSVPILLDVRPIAWLARLRGWGDPHSYQRRVLHGVRLAIGPSFELVRTSLDTSLHYGDRIGSRAQASIGLHTSFDAEIPLKSGPDNGLSVRLSTRLLNVPIIVLNDGAVQSTRVVSTAATPGDLATTYHGRTTHVQFFAGLVYYL